MANQFLGWTPSLQFPTNTAYAPVVGHEMEPLPSPAKDKDFTIKPTEPLIHASEKHDEDQESHFSASPRPPEQTFHQAQFGGLRRTLRFFLAIAVVVLLINISWLGYAATHYGGLSSGYGSIQRGNCDAAKRTNTWLHLLINILSTLLLTGSNAFMGVYCCPSRKEVDQAHARRKWLHVGMLSMRNFSAIAVRKSAIVILLCLSSLPFHLLYNSLVFVSLSTNNYYWTVVDESFVSGAPYNLTGDLYYESGSSMGFTMTNLPDGTPSPFITRVPKDQALVDQMYDFFDGMQRNATSWDRLSNRECIQAYSNVFISERRNLILVSSAKNATDSLLTYNIAEMDKGDMDENWWICSIAFQDGGNMVCQPDEFLAKADGWTVFDWPIEYCLSEPVESVCEVEFSLAIMAIVIVFNAFKVLAMTWVLWRYNAESILTTVGDATASFLLREDPTTRGMCLADRTNIVRLWKMPGTGVPYTARRRRWGVAVSRGKWWLFSILMFFSFALIFAFGAWGFYHLKAKRGVSLTFSSLWNLGFGAPHQDAIVIYDLKHTGGTIAMALMANIPQIFLAAVWLLYMGIVTSMFLAADWATFGSTPHTLQVSSPAGQQRGSWLLGAPPAYGAVLLVLQVILHWLVSQSIFVISISIYTPDGSQPHDTMSKFVNCGYSPIAIIFAVIASFLLIVSVIALAVRRFPAGAPPAVASCTAAISAACHMPPGMDYHGLLYEPLRWGQVGPVVNGVAHCSLMPDAAFQAGHGVPPTVGWHYAGLKYKDEDGS